MKSGRSVFADSLKQSLSRNKKCVANRTAVVVIWNCVCLFGLHTWHVARSVLHAACKRTQTERQTRSVWEAGKRGARWRPNSSNPRPTLALECQVLMNDLKSHLIATATSCIRPRDHQLALCGKKYPAPHGLQTAAPHRCEKQSNYKKYFSTSQSSISYRRKLF